MKCVYLQNFKIITMEGEWVGWEVNFMAHPQEASKRNDLKFGHVELGSVAIRGCFVDALCQF